MAAWSPALLLVAVAAALLLIRRLPPWLRIAVDLACFAATSGWLVWKRQYPVFVALPGLPWTDQLGLQAIEVAWWLLGARFAASSLRFLFGHDRRSREIRLFSDLSAAAVYIAAILAVLGLVLDLPIRGLVATSGVIAIVIGLALQNTLADVFSGIAVGVEQPFRVGDRIFLGDKVEGVVVQMNWRSIRIQTDENDIATVPNSTVAKAEIVNRSFPTQQRGAKVEVVLPGSIAPERAIELLHQAVLLCPNLSEIPAPTISLVALGEETNAYAIGFTVADGKTGAAKGNLLQQVRRLFHHAGVLGLAPGETVPAVPARRDPSGLLRELILFEMLSDAKIGELAAQLRSRTFEPGETLFAAGDDDTTLYMLADGIVELHRGDEGAPVGRIGSGEYLGELSLLTGSPHVATAVALTRGTAYLLVRDAIAPLMEDPQLVAAMEAAVRHGRALLHREVAVRASSEIGGAGHLLARIRGFFQFRGTTAEKLNSMARVSATTDEPML